MKVLLFTNLFPSRLEPTRGLFNLHRFRALANHCSVRVVAPVPVWQRIKRPGEVLRVPSGIHEGLYASYPTYWAIPRLKPDWQAASMFHSVRSHIRSIREDFAFDVVLGAFAYPDAVAAESLAADVGCPFVALVMGSDMNVLATRPSLRNLIRDSLRRAHSVIAVSSALKDRVIELGIPAGRIVVQPNGVDGQRFTIRDKRESRRLLGVRENGPLACFIGNVVSEKGPDVLVDAISQRGGAMQSINVAIIGDGDLKDKLKAKVDQLGLSMSVRFLGRQAPETIPLWLAAADLLCLPSRREGCPNVVLEALAAGRPVVASRVGGVPELLNDQNGIMVPPENAPALAAGIAAALERPWNAVQLRASVPSLSWEDSGETFYHVLLQAVERFDPRQ